MSAPWEYVIIGFPDNNFTGEIAPELADLVDAGVIRIIDLLFVSRGDDGTVVSIEVDEHDNLTTFLEIDGEVGGVITPEDVEHAAASIDAGSSILIIVWEDLWAASLVDAVRRAGGTLLEGARVPAELTDKVNEALAAAG
jgi:hypothetical protein